MILLLTLLFSVGTSYAQSLITNPPVARTNVAYAHSFPTSLIFPASTSDRQAASFNYTVDQSPSWLNLTLSDSLITLTGTPHSKDAYSSWVRINRTSSDSKDVLSRGFRLSVSSNEPPKLNLPLATQLLSKDKKTAAVVSSATPLASDGGSAGLTIPSTWSFSAGFLASTFTSSAAKLYYTATVNGQQGVPSWLGFDNTTLTFYGNTPDLAKSAGVAGFLPQTFNITVGCSDVPDTPPAVTDSFIIVVTPQDGKSVFPPMNVTVGSEISYDVWQSFQNGIAGTSGSSVATFSSALGNISFAIPLGQSLATWLSWNR